MWQARSATRAGKVVVPTSRRAFRHDPAKWSSGLSGDYAGYPATARLIDKLVWEEDFKRAYLEQILARVERQQWILDCVNRPRAKRSTWPTGAWARYRAKFLTPDNISKGIDFWRRYDKVLRRAQAQYGVPPEYMWSPSSASRPATATIWENTG